MSRTRNRQYAPIIIFFLGLGFCFNLGNSLKVPFRANDVLPVLPRQISWPVLNNLHSAVDLMPSYVGSVTPLNNQSIQWKGACFYENSARLEFTDNGDTGLGGGLLHLKTSSAHSWTCMDLYVFATPYRVTWDYYFASSDHTLKIGSWEEAAELEYVKQHGISVFLLPSGMLGTFLSLVDVLPLFSDSTWGQHANLAFLEKHMGATFEKRPQPWQTIINPEDVHSGDFLAVSKIRGRWGGFETLEKWVTGAFAGHTAVCLKDEHGSLWVGESGHENEKGEEIIAIIPWDEWWELALKDKSNPQIALLPLHPDMRAKFNSTAAWEFARSMSGKPYGYHNMIFSWIDTIGDNFPPPLDAHLVISVMSMWTRVQPAYAANMWNEALNKRLGTEGLDLYEILLEIENRGIAFEQLLTIPEQDEWVYSDGKSTTCVAFILAMYKEAGIFDPLYDSIQVTEFTIRDAYMLKIFESNTTRLPSWCNTNYRQVPFCQILGEYHMELPEYNTIEPYANMNENCPSLPPHYQRPLKC
ncbi:Trypsin-6 [Bienertia sinuspersici]